MVSIVLKVTPTLS